ncbi:PaaI family thioesterase [Pandoraea apista]|uniref:PaaI family thioesterase n=1 Tax=Pandoraea apista TaxID=93218 RepID=UPI00058AA301|nr:PaaI family thioesterase [Pandoraea apista]AJE97073.1 aromatic compound catabolic protein [Pandoraea apista]AKH71026.1 aromatic compound catabolic protein [Pandoraea apista]AKI63298.1 aromatic compound catabolic protein [Pandoraea apista]AVF41657.1 PaaI family thioesterase [Pandoraea apista]
MSIQPDAATVLAQWEADEAAVRERLARSGPLRYGVATPSDVIGLSGLEIFQAMFDGKLPMPPISETLGFLAIEIANGRAVFQGRPALPYYNPLGSIHGGWYATLLDSAVACAIHSTLPVGRSYTTLELKTNMVRALTRDVPCVRAEGNVIQVGRQVGIAEGRIVGPDGTLYAHATTTCLIFDLPTRKA